jgi:hypothetical protein
MLANINLLPNTLADLSQFFSILSDLNYSEITFLSSANHLVTPKVAE